MHHITTTSDLEEKIFQYKKNDETLAFVPTMGYLHQGHMSLIRLAKKNSDRVIVSIFVNPTQFTNPEDLKKYPRDIEKDIAMLEKENIDIIFFPEEKEIYPEGQAIENIILPEKFFVEEGATRPGHFEGVYQVLKKFFTIITPDTVVFGQKDFQQTLLVQHLLEQEFPDISLLIGKIFREPSGLAMSSRNTRLSAEGKKNALILSEICTLMKKNFSQGICSTEELLTLAEQKISSSSFVQQTSSLCFRDGKNFQQQQTVKSGDIFIIALTIEGIHLLDNIIL